MNRFDRLKILKCFADSVYVGDKTFEVRSTSDRSFSVGEVIGFDVYRNDGLHYMPEHPLNNMLFRITYILTNDDFPCLKEGYVAFSIKPVNTND